MSDIVTFTNPVRNYDGSGGASASVPVTFIGFEQEFGSVSAFTFHVESSIAALYGLDTDANNPAQRNSTFELEIDGQDYGFGYVIAKPRKKTYQEGEFLELRCWGLEGALVYALCPNALISPQNPYFWSLSTSAVAVTALALQKTSAYGSFIGDTIWPDPGDSTGADCYIQDSDSPTDNIDAEILIGTAAPFYVELSTGNVGFQPRGWLKIGSEWFYYEGYDDTGTGGKYRVNVTARAQLGTSAAGHAAAAAAYNKIAKELAPGTCELKRDGTRLRRGTEFKPHAQLGCFVLGGAASSNVYTADCSYYDEDATLDATSTCLTVEEVVGYLCGGDPELGGAGFQGGQMDFDTIGLRINRYDYNPKDKSPYAWQAIQDLIAAVGLEDELQFWFDHRTGKLRLAIVAKTVATLALDHVESVDEELTLEDCFNGVLVGHTDDQPVNRVHKDFFYHAGAAASGAQPDKWVRTTAGGGSHEYGTNTESTSGTGGNFGADMLYDGDPATKLTAHFEHDPGGAFDFGHAFFDATASTVVHLSRIAARIGNYRAAGTAWGRTTANVEGTYLVKLQGSFNYDYVTHTGDWLDLGCEIEGKPDTAGVPELVEFTNFLLPAVNAVRLLFVYMAGRKATGEHYWAPVHELIIEGNNLRWTYVQTSPTEQVQSEYVYAPASHKKLRGGPNSNAGGGAARAETFEIGPASDTAARSAGRARLFTKLAQNIVKNYEYEGVVAVADLPQVADTIKADEDGTGGYEFTGIARAVSMQSTYAGRSWAFRLTDPEAAVIT